MAAALLLSVAVIWLLCCPHVALGTARGVTGRSKRTHQTFLIGEIPSSRSSQQLQESLPEGTWAVGLYHRDSLNNNKVSGNVSSSSSGTRQEVLAERLKRDGARVKAIGQRVELAMMGRTAADLAPKEGQGGDRNMAGSQELDLSSPIVSGLSQGSGEYFTRFGIGTPPADAYFVMDTGSDLSWTQCRPCSSCYQQTDPLFDPSASSSFQAVTCSSPLCSQLLIRGCQKNQCLYQVSYGDGSFTVGDFALESFTFGSTVVKDVAVGCGHDNEGLFIGAAGLLGLGSGKLSFPTQIQSAFSYCLVDRFSGAGGSSQLIFGSGAVPSGSVFTRFTRNPKIGTFYYVELAGLSVGGSALPLPASTFALDGTSGSGGVIIDSGTSVTRLVTPAYNALRDAFLSSGASRLPSAGSFSLFDTCFNLGGMKSVDVPTVSFDFGDGSSLELPAANYLIPVDASGTYCFGFAPSSAPLSIIGNVQQQGFRVSYDAMNARVGFAPNQC